MTLISFSFVSGVARYGESRQPCIVPDFCEIALNFSFNLLLAIAYYILPLIYLGMSFNKRLEIIKVKSPKFSLLGFVVYFPVFKDNVFLHCLVF